MAPNAYKIIAEAGEACGMLCAQMLVEAKRGHWAQVNRLALMVASISDILRRFHDGTLTEADLQTSSQHLQRALALEP